MQLSFVVVAYDMPRELPRTLETLSTRAQGDLIDYEVIVVDNGSPIPVPDDLLDGVPAGRLIRLDPAPPSPARAANVGLAAARGAVKGVLIDGARMASPGMAVAVADSARLGPRTIVATPAYHLGRSRQGSDPDYDQRVEDDLLASVDWRADGNQLFAISVFAASSARGFFGPMGESNAVFMHGELWDELGGYDETFARPGGGLANHDLYRRACESPGVQLVVLLGEGTFHQVHGGASTGGHANRDELWAEYESIRGRPHEPPTLQPLLRGPVRSTALAHLDHSVDWYRRHVGAVADPAGSAP